MGYGGVWGMGNKPKAHNGAQTASGLMPGCVTMGVQNTEYDTGHRQPKTLVRKGLAAGLSRAPFKGLGGGPAPPSPPPRSGAEFWEALKAPEKIFDRPKARKKNWPNLLRRGGGLRGVGG